VEQLYIGDTALPEMHEDSLMIKVKAAGLNRADINQRKGNYPPPEGASDVLGLEVAGVVHDVGSRVTEWKKGDRVCALLPGGGYAEYAEIPQDMGMRIPESLSFEEAASIPEAFLTAWQALKLLAGLDDNKRVLIHAGASGVGSAAIQICKQFRGTQVLFTVGSDEKIEFCKKLGADIGFNRKDGPWADKVLAATDNQGVDIVLDFVGANYWEQNLKVLGLDGTMVILAYLGGAQVPGFDMSPFLKKRITVRGSTLRARSKSYKVELTRDFVAFGLPRFADRRLVGLVDKVFPWQQVGMAHEYMEADQNTGKIILNEM